MPTSQSQFLDSLWSRFSSLHTLERVVAYVLKFYSNLKSRTRSANTLLSPEEIDESSRTLLRLAQRQGLADVHSAVSANKSLPMKHPLYGAQLSLIRDVLHVATRVRIRNSPSSPKLLVLLPPKSGYTSLVLLTAHSTHHHPGVGALQAIVGDHYHVRGLRNALKLISRQCAVCQRAYA